VPAGLTLAREKPAANVAENSNPVQSILGAAVEESAPSGEGNGRRAMTPGTRCRRPEAVQPASATIAKTLSLGSLREREKGQRLTWSELLLARQLTRSTVLSAQISILYTSADLPSAYFPRRST
jgi:hypothetical protein